MKNRFALVSRLLAALIVVTLGALAATTPAGAHAADEAYVYLNVSESALSGRVELAFIDVESTFGVELDGSGEDVIAVLEARLDELRAYVDEHLSIGSNGTRWDLDFTTLELLFPNNTPDFNHVQIGFDVDVPGSDVPRELEVTFDPFFDEVEERVALLLIENDWAGGVFDNEAESLVAFDDSNRTRQVDLGDTSQWSNFTSSIGLGVDHIRTGPDHIFFVIVLLLPSVLLFVGTMGAGSWMAAPTFGSALWRVLKIATMFTVAHSITFTLAGMDILPLPSSKFVESLIALSIAAAALNNIKPVALNKEWALAFGFGLFHGMGFAGLVSGLDVSQTTQLVTLLGRNVGIEIGQIVVILLLFPGLYLLRRTVHYRPLFLATSLVLAAVSLIWTVERVFEQDFGISRYVEEAIEWPRVLVPILVFTIAAASLYRREAAADRLLPVADSGATADDESELVDA